MLWRVRNSRGRPKNAPAGFIHPCRPTVSQRPPRGEGWVHELKHDGYRLQIHVRDGRVRLYTMNAADWTKRYPRIVEEAARIKGSAILDAEVVCLDAEGVAQFDTLHTRCADNLAVACAFDLLMLNGDDLRGKPLMRTPSSRFGFQSGATRLTSSRKARSSSTSASWTASALRSAGGRSLAQLVGERFEASLLVRELRRGVVVLDAEERVLAEGMDVEPDRVARRGRRELPVDSAPCDGFSSRF